MQILSLEQCRIASGTAIAAISQRAKEMNSRYKETSERGLAVSFVIC
jgi:L-serine deaminase